MVEGGVKGGLEQGVREVSKADGGIARAIKRMRQRSDAQISRSRTEAEERHRKEVEAMRKRWQRATEKRGEQRQRTVDDFRTAESVTSLDDALMEDELVSLIVEGPRLTAWQRFVTWLRKLWYRFVSALARFWRWATGRGKGTMAATARPGRKRLLLKGIGYESQFGEALFSSPALKREVDQRIRAKGADAGEARLSLMANQERYMDAAVEAFEEYVREKRHGLKEGQAEKKQRMEERLRKLTEEERESQRELERRLEELAKAREKELARLEEEATEGPRKEVEKEVLEHFKRMGYLQEGPEGLSFTSRIIDRFAELVYAQEMEAMQSRLQARTGQSEALQGTYEKTRMRTVHEISRMDIVESIVNARTLHPRYRHMEDEDLIINHEVSSERSHVVLMFDKSSSMEENNRLLAAKKAVLALYKAAKRANPRNIVDLATFDTKVSITDLNELWGSAPSGFTNTGEAIKVARELIRTSRADKKLVYLITDGLPEAYTTKDGQAKAGDRKLSLDYALEQAGQLARVRDQRMIVLLLEPEADIYVEAATQIAKKAAGSLIVTDPQHLAGEMLVDYVRADA
jgi:Mg-chelatase subunit ChlD